MYERFTDRARFSIQLANHEALRLNQEYIHTEHLLLGIVCESPGIGMLAIGDLGVSAATLLETLTKELQRGLNGVASARLPQSRRCKKAIEFGMEEARGLRHRYIGTEHILLGLLRVEEGTAARVLESLGIGREKLRSSICNRLEAEPSLADLATRHGTLKEPPEYWSRNANFRH